MNENGLYIVKEYKIDNPIITKTDSIVDCCYRSCHNKYYHTFAHFCEYDLNFKIITNNEIITLTMCGKNMALYGLKKN